MITHNCDQYSDAWWDIRKGIPTASRAKDILTPGGKMSTTSKRYMNELLAERFGISEEPMEPTEWMTRGLELEPEARRLFEFESDMDVEEVGFITNDDATAGCSPDGIVTGLVEPVGFEVKCPKPSTHIGYLLGKELPAYYRPQIHWSMAVTGFTKWTFMSYHPDLQPLIITVEWDEYTDQIVEAIERFTILLNTSAQELGL